MGERMTNAEFRETLEDRISNLNNGDSFAVVFRRLI